MRTRCFAAAAALLVAAPAGAAEISYMMWDANQKPAYEACAADFQKANPDITIKIGQLAWNDYWSAVTTGIVAGTAPDVFTDHLARYPEFALDEQIVDIAPLIKRDKVPTDICEPGLFDLWGREGKQFGLPKDWDTIAVFYNTEMLKAAGVDPRELSEATWNSKDGGSFEKIIAKLTLDDKGNNATSPNFNPKAVKQFGLLVDTGDLTTGQTGWANFAATE